jgi:hypothetical protein
MVFVAVSKLLTLRNPQVIKEIERLISPLSPEKQMVVLRRLVEKGELNGEKSKYAAELEKAESEAAKAAEAISGGGNYHIRTNYGEILVRRPINNPSAGYFVLKAPTPELLGEKGFPSILMSRSWQAQLVDMEDLSKRLDPRDEYNKMLDILEKLGLPRDQADLQIRNSMMYDHFIAKLSVNRITEILKQDSSLPTPLENPNEFYDRRIELMRIVYERLTPEEQRQLCSPSEQNPMTSFTLVLREGDQEAVLRITCNIFGATAEYDSTTGKMKMDLENARWLGIDVELEPIVTPESRHDQMMKLRERALQLVRDAGWGDSVRIEY